MPREGFERDTFRIRVQRAHHRHTRACRLKCIVVTHLAQVAAYADAQLVVSKMTNDGGASTTVAPVQGDARVAEVARMLSGNDSEASRTHARELLGEAT